MGVIAQYEVSASVPSVINGTGGTKYFSSGPTIPQWNAGATGVGARVDSSQLGNIPSVSNALGQLSFDSVAGKLNGGRVRLYATGSNFPSLSTLYGVTPTIQVNTGTLTSPNYVPILNGFSATVSAGFPNLTVTWSVEGDLFSDPKNSLLFGTVKGSFATTANALAGATAPYFNMTEQLILGTGGGFGPVTGLSAGGFGLVVGMTFVSSDPLNVSSLYEFKVVQD